MTEDDGRPKAGIMGDGKLTTTLIGGFGGGLVQGLTLLLGPF